MERGLRAKARVVDDARNMVDDIIFAELDSENTKKEDMIKILDESGKVIGEACKSIHKKIEERLTNDDGTRYTTEDIIRMREEKKLAREFKAKDWI